LLGLAIKLAYEWYSFCKDEYIKRDNYYKLKMSESILYNTCVQNWVFMGPMYVELHHIKNNNNYKELALIEKHSFGTTVIDKGVQWSNSLGEKIVYDILVSFGFNVTKKAKVIINERILYQILKQNMHFMK
jgi:hypothetical protein